ncbi:MAG: polysaccharide pyruvyl transferase family protein [Chlamydiales bacterium]
MIYLILAMKLFWWSPDDSSVNFGDHLSKVLIERMLGASIPCETLSHAPEKMLFGIGSILEHAEEGDVIWGSGFLFERTTDLKFKQLEVHAVRGPLTARLLWDLGIECPEIYGDPTLLFPRYFPEFKREEPVYEYIIIPHVAEMYLFLPYKNVVYPTESWDEILRKILKAKLVISSSLHGIILAEAFGVPARLLMMNLNTSLFKFRDYYAGTGRETFQFATSVHQALEFQGERPPEIDLNKLDQSFPLLPTLRAKEVVYCGHPKSKSSGPEGD